MADKDKTTKKKSYKKPTADNLNDGDLKDVTGGEGSENIIGFCNPAGAAAIGKCGPGGAALGSCHSGGAAKVECRSGSKP